MRNVLRVVVCCSLTFGLSAGTTRAQCPPSPDQLSLRVIGSVRRDAASGMFAYSFQVASAPSSPQAAWTFGVEVPGSVSEVGKPNGWRGRQLDVRPWVHWTAKTQESRIAPGAAISGFSFLSPQPPGMTVFHASGYVAPPRVSAATEGEAEAAAETLVERCPQLAMPRIDQGISGNTIGPVDATRIGVEVKPGSDRAPINPGSRGVIPVAILGSPSLEIGTIDRGSVRLVPSGAAPARSSFEDVNGDGIRDLMLHFRTEDAQLTCSDTTVVLSARSTSGALLAGFDQIVAISCR